MLYTLWFWQKIIINEALVCQCIRPGFGLHPKYYQDILGKKANSDIERTDERNLEIIGEAMN